MTYAAIVRAQFAKHRGAVYAFRVFLGLFVVATYAPAIALDVPFWTDLEGAPSSPWLRSLFDPRVFPMEVDVFFNLLMGTLPLLAAVVLLARRRRRALVLLWCALHLGGFVWLSHERAGFRQADREYPREIHAKGARAVWPVLRHHPSGRASEFTLTKPLRRGTLQPGAPAPADEVWPYYLLGADHLGNDVFTRLLYGARMSLTVGVIAVGIYVLIGVTLGSLAGYFGGWVDDLLLFFAQVVMTIPQLFLILFILSVVRQASIYHIMLVVGGLGWPNVMRLVRGEFLRQREIDYVTAARALGLGDRRVIFRHIVPNSLAPVFVSATFGVAGAILLESTLSFLGLVSVEAPSWGQLLKAGFENSTNGRHLVWTAGGAIFFTVLVLNLIGEGLRDALDPKLRR
ncbi:MAG: ABC transporter permease [Planctomycetota bacterium]